jgi:hypothetical protein
MSDLVNVGESTDDKTSVLDHNVKKYYKKLAF